MVAQKETGTIYVEPVRTETVVLALVGTRPLVMNAMSEKARQDVLFPRGRMTTAQKQANIKHNPLAEFRGAAYLLADGETLLGMKATAVKGAMMTAALDLPGTRKAQIGRLVYVQDDYVPVFGVPKLFMDVVRSADMAHTPDVRTRPILPEWAALVAVTYVVPLLNATSIINLLAAGGITAGIGDFRVEKGKGNYGQFVVATPDDPRFLALRERGGRVAQEAAMDAPECYDAESAKMLAWHMEQVAKRGK